MPQQRDTQERCVVGAVKSRQNRDNSITFTVAGKTGKKFTLARESEHAKLLLQATRAIVRYEDKGKNPKVTLVLINPSGRRISQYTSS